jgi:hypothetical protein
MEVEYKVVFLEELSYLLFYNTLIFRYLHYQATLLYGLLR